MTTPQIIRIPILPFGMVNAHLILGSNGCIIVDTGLPGSESKIEKALKQQKLSFKEIKLIVITHAHMDHAGSAARLRELSGAPILAHKGDVKHYSQEATMTFCPTGWFGRLVLKTGFPLQPYTGFKPDILLSDDEVMDLNKFGIPGFVMHSPGHTVGSISLELSTNDALVGDLIASGILIGGLVRTSHSMRPPFEDDPRTVGLALQHLLNCGMERFYLGHGGPLNAREVQRHAHDLMALKAR